MRDGSDGLFSMMPYGRDGWTCNHCFMTETVLHNNVHTLSPAIVVAIICARAHRGSVGS